MARPVKTGLTYFPFDVDFFDDDKIQLITAEFGIKGEIIAIKLLCKIYKNGYYYQWGNDEALLFASKNGYEISLVNEVVKRLIKRSFFDERVFNSFQVLTSRGIQNRFLEAKLKAKGIKIISEYLLYDINSYNNAVNVVLIGINGEITVVNSESSTQSKVNKSKEKKIESNAHTREEFSLSLVFSFFYENSREANWTKDFCEKKAAKFFEKYSKSNEFESDVLLAKVKSWIIDERFPETELDMTNRISDGRVIPDVPNKVFHASLKTNEDRKKTFEIWRKAGYEYRDQGKTSEIGWFKKSNSQSNGPDIISQLSSKFSK